MTTDRTIYVRGNVDEIRRQVIDLPAFITGQNPAGYDAAKGMALRLGVTAMGLIRDAYVVKARGGTDESGMKWAPLAPSTIAGRLNKNPKTRGRKAANRARIRRAERKVREALKTYKEAHKQYLEAIGRQSGKRRVKGQYERERYRTGADVRREFTTGLRRERSKQATQLAGFRLRKARKARLDLVKAVQALEILRDTGRTLNSLSPGVSGELRPDGHLEVRPGEVIVGTNIKHAIFHHSDEPRQKKADGTDRLPQRRFWPKVENWPQQWWRDLNEAAASGALEVAVAIVSR